MKTIIYVVLSLFFTGIDTLSGTNGLSVLKIFTTPIKFSVIAKLIEYIVEAVVRKDFTHYNRKLRLTVKIQEELKKSLESLSDEERKELDEFLKEHPLREEWQMASRKLSGKKDKENALKSLFNSEIDREKKAFVKDLLSKMQEVDSLSIEPLDSKKIIRELFDVDDGEEIPNSLISLVGVIKAQTYELTYIGLSVENRDLAKTIQHMLYMNNENIVSSLQSSMTQSLDEFKQGFMQEFMDLIAIILNQHESGMLKTATSRATIANNPYCYVKLECPDCHATGAYLVRINDQTHCQKCGVQYNIVKNIKETEQFVENAKNEILAQMKEINEETKYFIQDSADQLGQKIVMDVIQKFAIEQDITREDFEKKLKDAAQAEGKNLCAKINDMMKEQGKKSDAINSNVQEVRAIMDISLQGQLNIQKGIYHIIGQNDEVLERLYEIQRGQQKAQKAQERREQEVYQQLQVQQTALEFKNKEENTRKLTCKCCGKTEKFKFKRVEADKSDAGRYICPHCGFKIAAGDVETPNLDKYNIAKFKRDYRRDEACLYKKDSNFNPIRSNQMIVYLEENAHGSDYELRVSSDYNNLLSEIEKIILRSETKIDLSEKTLSLLVNKLSYLKEIAIGERVRIKDDFKLPRDWKIEKNENNIKIKK